MNIADSNIGFFPSGPIPSTCDRAGAYVGRVLLDIAEAPTLDRVVSDIEILLDEPASLIWPGVFGPPATYKSFHFDKISGAIVRRYRVAAGTGSKNSCPIVLIKEQPNRHQADLMSLILESLGRRWRDTKMAQREKGFQLLNELWIAVRRCSGHTQTVCAALLDAAQRFTQAPIVCVAACGPGRILSASASFGIFQPHFAFQLAPGHGLGGHVLARQQPAVVPDYRTYPYRDSVVSGMIDQEGIRSIIALPWKASEDQYGVIYIAYRRAGMASSGDVTQLNHLIRAIGTVYASAMTNSAEDDTRGLAVSGESVTVLKLLQAARKTQELTPLYEVARLLNMSMAVYDEWGQSVFDSGVPRAPATHVIHLKDESYGGILALWPTNHPDRVSTILPELQETAAWLLEQNSIVWQRAQEHRTQWLTSAMGQPHNVTTIWEQSVEHGLPATIHQIGGVRCPGQNLWSEEFLAPLARYLDTAFGAVLCAHHETLWIFMPHVYDALAWQNLLQTISDHGGPLCLATSVMVHGQSVSLGAVIGRLNGYLHTLPESYSGIYHPLESSTMDDLLTTVNTSHLNAFVGQWLGGLVCHEQCRDLVPTLHRYLTTGSIPAVAESLYLHQNTVRYRITKILELLKLKDLKDPAVRENLWLASHLWTLQNGHIPADQ